MLSLSFYPCASAAPHTEQHGIAEIPAEGWVVAEPVAALPAQLPQPMALSAVATSVVVKAAAAIRPARAQAAAAGAAVPA